MSNAPIYYMPMYWGDFFNDTVSWTNDAIVAYQKTFWYYWHNLECEGIPDRAVQDDAFLERIFPKLDSATVEDCRALIFDNDKRFVLDVHDNVWRHHEWDFRWGIANKSYQQKVKAANAGVIARLRKQRRSKSPPPPTSKSSGGECG